MIFEAAHQRLTRLAQPNGLVVILDDLHLADIDSLALLVHIVRHLRGSGLLIVATVRGLGGIDDSTRIIHGLLAEMGTSVIELDGLDADAVQANLTDASIESSEALVASVLERTSGNAFLVTELSHHLAKAAPSDPATELIPRRVVDVTRHRLQQLSPELRELLRAAAIVGLEFPIGVVASMLSQPALQLLPHIDEARTAHFLVGTDTPGTFRFAHALIRSAIEQQLTTLECVVLHRSAAEAIERLYADRLRSHLPELARHWAEVAITGDRARAVETAEAAGDMAFEEHGFEEATRLYRTTLALGGDEMATEHLVRLRLALAVCYLAVGDFPSWQQTIRDVAADAAARGDVDVMARAALVMEPTGDPGWDREVWQTCRDACALPALGIDLRARVLARQSQALAFLGDESEALRVSSEAMAQAGRSSDPIVLIDALRARQIALSSPEGVEERVVLATRLLDVARSVGRLEDEMWARLWRIDTLFELGDFEEVPDELARLERCVAGLAGPIPTWHLLATRASWAHTQGRFGDAVRDSSHAYALMSRLGLPTAFGKYGSQISLIGRYIGFDASGFRALMSDRPAIATIDVFVYSVFPSLIEVLLHAETGDLDTARSVYGSVGPVSGWRFPPSLRNYAWGLGILAAAYVGELDDVAEFHRRLLPFAEREIVNSSGQSGSLGPAQLCLGYAAQALDRQDEAIERFGAAVELCLARGAVPAGVECRIALAEALAARRAPGDAAKATATLELAEPIARRLTMAPMHARIARLRSHLGSSSGDRDTATATEASPPLSAREAEVAALCADGLTNKQIATRLFISERTAQNHVQHILRRLGFTSRSQIAVWHAIDVSGRDE